MLKAKGSEVFKCKINTTTGIGGEKRDDERSIKERGEGESDEIDR